MKYFKSYEFDSKDKKGSGKNMSPTFLQMINEARGIAGIPFRITSGYRTLAHNTRVGGKHNSAHLDGLAADIRCSDSRSRSIILSSLQAVGFTRMGIAKSFIHVDCDTSKAQNVIWLY